MTDDRLTVVPELNGELGDEAESLHHKEYGDRLTALLSLLAVCTRDDDIRELANIMLKECDAVSVMWHALTYAARVNPAIRTEGTRTRIISELDDLRESMLLADQLTRWRTK